MPTVREYETALQRNPADTEAFVALRKAYRQAQKHDKLVTLYETRAQAIEDGPKAAELFYLAAELRIDQLGDAEGAEVDLANAVDRDASHIRAAARLKDIYREQGRTADYMTMLEMEAAAVARTRDPARIAELQSEMGQLFVNHFAKLEKSVHNAQRPGKLSQDNVKSIESARKIYRALGDYRAVVRLYELELEGTTEAKRRADLFLGLGRVLAEKLEELDAAAQRLGEVIRLRPRDEKALELLARDLLEPELDRRRRHGARGRDPVPDRAPPAGGGRRRQRGRGAAPRAAGGARPPRVVGAARARLLRRPPLLRSWIATTASASRRRRREPERIDFLYKRAQLAEGEMNDPAEAVRVYSEIANLEPPNGPAAARLVELFLGQPRLRQARRAARAAAGRDRGAGRAHPHHDRARGAVPRSPRRSRSVGGLPARDLAARSREPGRARRLRRSLPRQGRLGRAGRPARVLVRARARARRRAPRTRCAARGDRRRLREEPRRRRARAARLAARRGAGSPTYARAREAQRRLLLKGKNWDRMAALLEREAALQEDPAQKAETLRRVAQIHREKLGDAKRAVEIYKGILRAEPHDAVALRALVEIFEREGDFAGLAKVLREQIDLNTVKQERVSLLRRLVVIYDERLGNLPEAIWAASEILQTVPGDRDTLARLEALLERAGDVRQLVERARAAHPATRPTPTRSSSSCAAPPSWCRTSSTICAGAAARWEEVARLDPDDAKALDSLDGDLHQARAARRARARARHAGRSRGRRSDGAGRVPAQARGAGRGAAQRHPPRAALVGEHLRGPAGRHRGAGRAVAHLQRRGRLGDAGAHPRQADPAGQGAHARRRAGAAARADLRRAAAQHRRRGARASSR